MIEYVKIGVTVDCSVIKMFMAHSKLNISAILSLNSLSKFRIRLSHCCRLFARHLHIQSVPSSMYYCPLAGEGDLVR